MKLQNRFSKLIAISLAVAAIAVVGYITTAEAQNVRVFKGTALAGFIPGQSLYFSMANLSRPEEGGGPVRAQVRLFDAQGNVIARSQEVEVLAGRFHTFRFDRDDLLLAGEEETGRLQVGADFQFQADASVNLISPEHLLVTIEGVDNRTGSGHLYGGDYYCGTVSVSGD